MHTKFQFLAHYLFVSCTLNFVFLHNIFEKHKTLVLAESGVDAKPAGGPTNAFCRRKADFMGVLGIWDDMSPRIEVTVLSPKTIEAKNASNEITDSF